MTAVRAALLLVLMLFVATGTVPAAESTGISGSLRYEPDAKRPWRYGRYYVSKAPGHTLSAALVCLRGRSLRGLQPRQSPAVTHVDQQDYRFIPETVAIRAGDSIRFTNSDTALHNVRAVSGDESFNISLAQDGEFVQPFRRAGNTRKPVVIGCAFHSQMQAWVYVFDHPFFAVTAEDGKFQFDAVPAGDYDLEIIHPSGKLQQVRPVQVKAGETLELDLTLTPDDLMK
jgi:plastocyanin